MQSTQQHLAKTKENKYLYSMCNVNRRTQLEVTEDRPWANMAATTNHINWHMLARSKLNIA